MNARLARVPNYLISLSLMALFAAALIADQARANLHAEIRAPSAFHTGTEEHIDRNAATNTWCRTHRRTRDADSAAIDSDTDAATGAPMDMAMVVGMNAYAAEDTLDHPDGCAPGQADCQ